MRTPGNRKGIALGVLSILLGVAALGAWRSRAPLGEHAASPSLPGSVAAAEEEPRAGGPSLPARRWEPGASFLYEVSTDGKASIRTQGGTAQDVTVKASGTLALTVIARTPAGATVRGDLRSGSVQQGAKSFTAEQLSAPFFFTAAPGGQVSSFKFSKQLPPEARGVLLSLASSLQVVAPRGRRTSWQAQELDTTGEYEAVYELSGETLQKRKEKYLGTQGPDGIVPLPAGTEMTVRSSTDLTLDASGWPKTMTQTESVDMTWREGVHVVSFTRAAAKLVGVEERPDLVAAGTPRDVTAAMLDREQLRAETDRQLVAGKSWKQLAAAVASKETGTRNRTQAQLGALFRLDPRAAKDAGEAIVNGDLDDNAKKRLCAALGSAGTPEAQRALSDVLASPKAPADRKIDAAIALAQVASPTGDTAAALDAAMGAADPGVSGTATLASGAVAHGMNVEAGNAQDLGQTQGAVAKLVAGLAGARTDAERLLYLQALGNTGDARAWPAIQPYLTSPSATLRAAAVFSLRLLTSDDVNEALIAAFHDPNAAVRRVAVSTIQYRSVVPLLAALDALIKGEPEVSVRITLLSALKTKLHEDEAVTDLVKWAAEEDPAKEVRKLARQILGIGDTTTASSAAH